MEQEQLTREIQQEQLAFATTLGLGVSAALLLGGMWADIVQLYVAGQDVAQFAVWAYPVTTISLLVVWLITLGWRDRGIGRRTRILLLNGCLLTGYVGSVVL